MSQHCSPIRLLTNQITQHIFSCRQLVDFAPCISTWIGGLSAMFIEYAGGLCAMFSSPIGSTCSQQQANQADITSFAKGMFSNHSETKDGHSPFCLKENLDWFFQGQDVRRQTYFIHHKENDRQITFLVSSNDGVKSSAANDATILTGCQIKAQVTNDAKLDGGRDCRMAFFESRRWRLIDEHHNDSDATRYEPLEPLDVQPIQRAGR